MSFDINNGAPKLARPRNKMSLGMLAAITVWLAIVGGGTAAMVRYSDTAGPSGSAPSAWPQDSQISFDSERPTVVMFLHPKCPCSRATVGELEVLLARFPKQLNAQVVFIKPAGTATNWEKTDLWRKASAIPDVKVSVDNSGVEAARFHAETSGQTLLYDRRGSLKFQGGITLGRGHAGDNPGRTALEEILGEGHSSQAQTPVFGCSLFEDQCKEGSAICKQP